MLNDKTMYVDTLKAICFAGYEATQGCCTLHDDALNSQRLAAGAFDLVVDEMLSEKLIDDIDKLYDSLPYLEECDYSCCDDLSIDFDNNCRPILGALMYAMKTGAANHVNVLGKASMSENMKCLLKCYYWYLMRGMFEAFEDRGTAELDEATIYGYDKGLLDLVKKRSGIKDVLQAWLYVNLAKCTYDAEFARMAVDELYDQCVLDELLK